MANYHINCYAQDKKKAKAKAAADAAKRERIALFATAALMAITIAAGFGFLELFPHKINTDYFGAGVIAGLAFSLLSGCGIARFWKLK